MAMDFTKLQPHKVSTDLSGYITYIYGAPKTGKTTLATQMDNCMILAFEQGYNALPGVQAQDILSWGDMKQAFRELKRPEVKALFSAVIVDTIDVAAEMCKKWICAQNGIEDLGDLGYGKGWTKFKDEFNDTFRGLTRLGYAVFFIGHHKETTTIDPATGAEKIVIRPALSNSTREVIAGMADIYGYAHQVRKDEMSVLTFRSTDGSIECGCRFKYMPEEITTNYNELIKALNYAINKEAEEHNGQFVTTERTALPIAKEYNYEEQMERFQHLAERIVTNNPADGNKITMVVDKYLGKGRKVSDTTPDQGEFIYLICSELEDMFN